MQVELLVIPECPTADEASRLVRMALDDVGLRHSGFTVRVIDCDDAARSRGFAGSPAFVVGGLALFDTGGSRGASARLIKRLGKPLDAAVSGTS